MTISENLYDQLEGQGIIEDKLKGCRKFTRDTKNHLLIRLYCKTVKSKEIPWF